MVFNTHVLFDLTGLMSSDTSGNLKLIQPPFFLAKCKSNVPMLYHHEIGFRLSAMEISPVLSFFYPFEGLGFSCSSAFTTEMAV